MITALLVAAALIQVGIEKTDESHWVATALSSPTAKAILAKTPLPVTDERGLSQFLDQQSAEFTVGSHPGRLAPKHAERYDAASKVGAQISPLIRYGKIGEAHRQLAAILEIRPDLEFWLADLSVDCDLLLGRYREAYRKLIPIVSAPGFSMENYSCKQFAIACAGLGLVYPGQGDYCRARLAERYSGGDEERKLDLRAYASDSAPSVLLTGCLSIGLRWNSAYLEMSLSLNPTNQLAADELIEFYGYDAQGRYSDVRRIAAAMARQFPPGPIRDKYEKAARAVAGKPDRPMPLPPGPINP